MKRVFDYFVQLVIYVYRLGQNIFKETRLLSQYKLLKKKKKFFLDKEHKICCEILSHLLLKQKLSLEKNYKEAYKLEREYEKKSVSMNEQSVSSDKQLSLISEKLLKKETEKDSLLSERELIENLLEKAFFFSVYKCRENALALKFLVCLKQTERKIRKILYTAAELYARYIIGEKWDKK
uniref:Uncharacterized protein n=1 Tax=Cyphia schlechteri TaxID=2041121 RepID=A0A291F515_9ASTR|nr:hypothetical protein Cyp_sch1Pt0869 [Cyphia schlechteri]YP_009436890.1 hypothetical protein Cyp_sch1Pt1802 [Cyphia schlechteri]ATG27228.1 hypothetical protein Cyp_sch1Pt0869 [Cyphia schlechteri]ATG27267.1 hypothetical protein Cyp_sch1Pt1802 [Cyphia schlechteri]